MLYREDCRFIDSCKKRYVMEMLCNLGGRTQGGYPDCKGCSTYHKEKKEERND